VKRNRSRAVVVCISWFEAHVRSLQVAAASCQIPLSIAKAARQKAPPTTLTSTGRNSPEPFKIPIRFYFSPQTCGIYWVRGS
jgi:hypothetical protein